jgi:hypothetical protein
MKEIYHDGIARQSMYRETVFVYSETCANCGSVKKTKNGDRYLYRYYLQNDDSLSNKKLSITGLYCCIDCMRDYNR